MITQTISTTTSCTESIGHKLLFNARHNAHLTKLLQMHWSYKRITKNLFLSIVQPPQIHELARIFTIRHVLKVFKVVPGNLASHGLGHPNNAIIARFTRFVSHIPGLHCVKYHLWETSYNKTI